MWKINWLCVCHLASTGLASARVNNSRYRAILMGHGTKCCGNRAQVLGLILTCLLSWHHAELYYLVGLLVNLS
jgi:hypothetical protein